MIESRRETAYHHQETTLTRLMKTVMQVRRAPQGLPVRIVKTDAHPTNVGASLHCHQTYAHQTGQTDGIHTRTGRHIRQLGEWGV
jgi:hypothetical protein